MRIDQPIDPFYPARMLMRSCQHQLAFSARSMFVGIPHSGRAARFIGPNGVGNAAQAGEYVSSSNGDVTLPRASQAVCYLTGISGAFEGGGEQVALRLISQPGGIRWSLQARHKSGQGTAARARCYARNQT